MKKSALSLIAALLVVTMGVAAANAVPLFHHKKPAAHHWLHHKKHVWKKHVWRHHHAATTGTTTH